MIKWIEVFRDHLQRCIGVRNVPLIYVQREVVAVLPECPPLNPGQPYSTQHGSIEEDLIARASHTHGLYHDDRTVVYYKLEEATRGTPYADSIKPFHNKRMGERH